MRVVRVFGGAEAVDHETIDDGEESDDGERSSSGSSSSSSSSSDSSSSGSSSSESEGEEREETGQLPANMPRTDGVASSALDGEGSVPAEDNGDGQQGDSPEVLPQDTEDVEMRSNDGRSRSRDPSSERELAVDSGGEEKASDAEMKSASGSGSGSSSESGSGSSSEDEKDRGSEEKSKPAEVENRDEANIQVEQSQPAEEKRKSRSSSSGSGSSSSSSPSSEDEGGKKGEEGDQKEVTAKDLFGADASDDSGSSSGSLKEKKKKRRRIRSESGSSRGSDKNKGASTLPAEVSVKDILGDLTSDEDDVQVLDEMKSPKRGDSEDEEFRKSPIRGDDFYEGRVTEDMAREGDEVVAVEEPPEPPPEARIEAEIPRISADLGKGFFFVRFPNFLSVDPKPFDGEHYEDEIDEEETQDEEGRARLKLKVENTIRWRFGYDSEQNTVKESNAKIVKWSDGSMSLYLGSEIFDVYKQPLHNDYNHLFVRQGTGLMGQAVFKSKLSFRPHSTDSFTHRKITLSLADRSQKTQKIKVISEVGVNPDVNRWERIKKEEEKLRFATRIQQKVRRVKEKASGKGLTAGFLEGTVGKDGMDEDEEGVSLTAIKNKYKSQVKAIRQSIYSSDSDSDVDKPKQRKQKRAVSDSDDEEGGKKEKGAKSESGSGSDSDASKASKSSKVSKASKVSKGSGAGSKKSGSGSGSGSGSSSSGSGSGSGSGSSSGSDDEGKGGAKGSGSGSE